MNRNLHCKNIDSAPLKDHSQIPFLIDTLIRKEHYNILIRGSHSEKINISLLTGLLTQLNSSNVPKPFREMELIYINCSRLYLQNSWYEKTLHELAVLEQKKEKFILAIDQYTAEVEPLVKNFLFDSQCRIIIFSNEKNLTPLQSFFSILQIKEPDQNELFLLIKQFRSEIENFHHVIIPDETLSSALSLAGHYLQGQSKLDLALELLDSSSARAASTERVETAASFKPIVTANYLSQIISHRTQVPVSHIQNNKFQAKQFLATMQKRIHGQDAALTMLANKLQHACIKLQKKSGPLCSFLLAGPSDTGKTETTYAIAEHLFGHSGALLRINLTRTHYNSLSDIKIIPDNPDMRPSSLLDAVRQTPYAVILIENIHQAPASTLDLFKDIFVHGTATDAEGNYYDFRNTIIVMTTTLGSEKISELLQTPQAQESTKTVDLMQLVLNDNLQENHSHMPPQISSEELCNEIAPALEAYFSPLLLHCMNVVPFVPLDYAAFEKIMRLKIKALAKQLEIKFGIELNYAPEVIKFIAHEALWRNSKAKSLDKLLEHHLYSCVAHEILAHSEDKNRPKRLVLQLNDNGQLLRCEFMTTNEAGLYAI